MQVDIKLGVNNLGGYTAVIFTFDAVIQADIFDLIRSFGDIFIKSLKVDGNKVTVFTKLPNIWASSAEYLNDYATGKLSFDEVKKQILEKVIYRHVKSMSTIPQLEIADKLNLEVTRGLLDIYTTTEVKYHKKYNKQYVIGQGRSSIMMLSISSNLDSKDAFLLQRDKYLTNTFISRLGLPIARWKVLDNPDEDIVTALQEFKLPLVIKPAGLTGGHGVTTGVRDLTSALKAIKTIRKIASTKSTLKEWQTRVMVQEQVPGEDFRMLVVDGEMRIATKRIPAFVTGDGSNTIRELIEITNKDPRRDVSNPRHTLKPIVIDDPLLSFLDEQGLSLDYVPKEGEKITVRKVASMSQGGITEDVTDDVHPQIKLICSTIAKSLNAFVLGIDIICEDISQPLDGKNGSVIEMNTMPEAYLNIYPTIGKTYEHVYEDLIKRGVGFGNLAKRVVTVGLSLEEIYKAVQRLGGGKYVGIFMNGKLWINNTLISEGVDFIDGVSALKINKLLDVLVIAFQSVEDVLKYGSGFDFIDEVFVREDWRGREELEWLVGK